MNNLIDPNWENERPIPLPSLEDCHPFSIAIPFYQEVLETLDAFSKVILHGRVIDQSGTPTPGALVEMWHPIQWSLFGPEYGPSFAPIDPDEQGWACCITDENGAYFFKTEKRTNQPGLPSTSIDFKVTDENANVVLTKIYFDENIYAPVDPYLMDMEIEQRRQFIGYEIDGACEFDILFE